MLVTPVPPPRALTRLASWLDGDPVMAACQSHHQSEALLAQMVERKTFNLVAVGSIPTEGVFCADLA